MRRLVYGACLVAALAGCGSDTAAPTDADGHGSLSDHEFEVGVAVARHETERLGGTVTSATATVGSGTVPRNNLGEPCTSGRLIHITLVGDFSKVQHGGVVGRPYEPVTAVLVTADPESGQPCLMSVSTGDVTPEPDATVLFTP